MAWQDKPIPKQGHTAPPIKWNPDIQDWEIVEVGIDAQLAAKLNTLEQTQNGILDRLNQTLNTSLTGRNVAVKDVNADIATSVSAGGIVTATVTPPAGVIWRTPLVWFWSMAPSGATTGTHRVQLYHGISTYQYMVLRAESNYNDDVRIMSNIAETATSRTLPTSEQVQQNAIQNLVISQDYPLHFTYYNSTDAQIDTLIEIRLIVLEEGVI